MNVSNDNEVVQDLQSIQTNLIPAVNATFSIGTSNKKWKDIYISGNLFFDANTNINLNAYNINCYQYAMPICFTISIINKTFSYNVGAQTMENVYNEDWEIPFQFFTENPNPNPPGYTSTIWKIDFALNCYDCGTTGDKAIALYIDFQDQNGTFYYPITYNLDTPYVVYQPTSTYIGVSNDSFQNFNWSDYVNLTSLVATGSSNLPLILRLWWAGESTTNNKFNLTTTLTRTNLFLAN